MAGILDTPVPSPEPDRPCTICGSTEWWYMVSEYGSGWECGCCHPNPNREGGADDK